MQSHVNRLPLGFVGCCIRSRNVNVPKNRGVNVAVAPEFHLSGLRAYSEKWFHREAGFFVDSLLLAKG
jgi:hypothetical protein